MPHGSSTLESCAPLIDPHDFRTRDVAEAHRLLESGKAIGKVVLEAP
jgi:NADPH:quinone reductase-like Zn-dependent oxidoreductase